MSPTTGTFREVPDTHPVTRRVGISMYDQSAPLMISYGTVMVPIENVKETIRNQHGKSGRALDVGIAGTGRGQS